MKQGGAGEAGGCLLVAFAAFGLLWWFTSPGVDQVCRQSKLPVFDWLHGTDGQPTCQQLIDEIESRSVEAIKRADDLETRVSELEAKLGQ